jgi:hypothetical protein
MSDEEPTLQTNAIRLALIPRGGVDFPHGDVPDEVVAVCQIMGQGPDGVGVVVSALLTRTLAKDMIKRLNEALFQTVHQGPTGVQ